MKYYYFINVSYCPNGIYLIVLMADRSAKGCTNLTHPKADHIISLIFFSPESLIYICYILCNIVLGTYYHLKENYYIAILMKPKSRQKCKSSYN